MFRKKRRILDTLRKTFGKEKTEGFNFDLVRRYYNNKDHSQAFQVLSDQTCEDLDFDLFFEYADRTSSKIGQQFLYNEMRVINRSEELTERREQLIKHFENYEDDRLEVQYLLQKLNNTQVSYVVDLFQKTIEKKPGWYVIIPILTTISALSFLLSFVIPKAILILLCVLPINVIVHYALKRRTNLFVLSVPSLLAMGGVARKLMQFNFIKSTYLNVSDSVGVIASIRRKMAFFKVEQKVDSDLEMAYWFLLEMLKITFLLEPLLLFSSLDKLRSKSKEIEDVFCFVGEVDLSLSIASLRYGLEEFCVPEIGPTSAKLQFQNLRHPLLEDCVANSLQTERSILLTGSNMSGKTTFIRALGLSFISGMTLNTCFASSAGLPMTKLLSVIRIEDDLMMSSSYFFREVDEMKAIIHETGKTGAIVLLDELFKGTNTKERIASAKAILSYLNRQKCQIFVSTHDVELTSMLENEFDMFHFSEHVSGKGVHFDYKLKKGVLPKGNAIEILSINAYPQEIVEEARRLSC